MFPKWLLRTDVLNNCFVAGFVHAGLTIQISCITLAHLIFQELISVIITPPLTPNYFWGFNFFGTGQMGSAEEGVKQFSTRF